MHCMCRAGWYYFYNRTDFVPSVLKSVCQDKNGPFLSDFLLLKTLKVKSGVDDAYSASL